LNSYSSGTTNMHNIKRINNEKGVPESLLVNQENMSKFDFQLFIFNDTVSQAQVELPDQEKICISDMPDAADSSREK